jgi:tetratricopeptide (TPR) repeat protein
MRSGTTITALALVFLLGSDAFAQNTAPPNQRSPLDITGWGVVYDVPATKHVKVRADVPYLSDARGTLAVDIDAPPDLKAGEQRQYEQAIPYLTRALEAGMRNSFIYSQLALSQLQTGRNEEALKSYEKAFEMGIPPGANTRGVAYFNMACGHTRLGQKEKALAALSNAVAEGFTNRNVYETDVDLAPLRAEPRFQEILARLPKS